MVNLALSPARLRSAREARKLTQEAAARLVDVSLRTITRAEAGEVELRALTLARLALAYGVPQEFFFDGHPADREAICTCVHPPSGGETPALDVEA